MLTLFLIEKPHVFDLFMTFIKKNMSLSINEINKMSQTRRFESVQFK